MTNHFRVSIVRRVPPLHHLAYSQHRPLVADAYLPITEEATGLGGVEETDGAPQLALEPRSTDSGDI